MFKSGHRIGGAIAQIISWGGIILVNLFIFSPPPKALFIMHLPIALLSLMVLTAFSLLSFNYERRVRIAASK